MTERTLTHALSPSRPPQIGMVVLQTDETIERDFRRLLPPEVECLVTRVPFEAYVTPGALAAMEGRIGDAVGLLPPRAQYECLAYCCTSASAQIGLTRIGDILRSAADTRSVTNPVSALIAACRHLGLSRLALLSPYSEEVSTRLREVVAANGVDTPVFGSFEVIEDARVVRIDGESIIAGTRALLKQGGVDGVFLSCTNLRTLEVIAPLEEELGLPVLSSNQVLAWHMLTLAGASAAAEAPGRLFRSAPAPVS